MVLRFFAFLAFVSFSCLGVALANKADQKKDEVTKEEKQDASKKDASDAVEDEEETEE